MSFLSIFLFLYTACTECWGLEPAQKPAVDFIPHRAEYTIQMHTKENTGSVVDVKGALSIELKREGNGWSFVQESTMLVYFNDGHAEQYVTKIDSFESDDGQNYRFDVRSLRNGVDEDFVQGHAYSTPTALGAAIYTSPFQKNVPLPVGTLFPITHLRKVMTAASCGESVFPDKVVFDGASDNRVPVDVNTIITPASGPKLVVDKPNLLSVDRIWALQMAIFSQDSKSPEPDYEITQNTLESGVITSMLMNYTEAGFSIKLTLSKVDFFQNHPSGHIDSAP